MKLPPGIDSAMWEVVESGDSQLMDEFAARYPEYKGELAKRLAMVRDLKGSRPRAKAAKPAFQPRPEVQPIRQASTWSTPLVLAAVAAAALFTFVVVKVSDQTRPQIVIQNPPPAGNPIQRPDSGMRTYLPEGEGQGQDNNMTPGAEDPSALSSNPPNQQTKPDVDPAQLDPFQRRVTITVEAGTLSGVLQDLATQANLVLEAAPGMPNDRIQAQYIDMPAIKVLEDLGRNFGFTALKQGRRTALLIPARDGIARSGGGTSADQNASGNPSLSGPLGPRSSSTNEGGLPPVGN